MRLRTGVAAQWVALEIGLRIVVALVSAHLLAGIFSADVKTYFERARLIDWNVLPYRDFLWEYPPLAVVPLILIPLTGRSLIGFTVAFVGLMIVLEYLSLLMLRRAVPSHARSVTVYWTVVVVPLCAIAYYRLDLLPTVFAAVMVVAVARGRAPGWTTVVSGFAAKLWPIVGVAVAITHRDWRTVTRTVLGGGVLLVAWWRFSPQGFNQFIAFRAGEGFQVESLPGSLLLAAGREPYFFSGAFVVSDEGFTAVQAALNIVLVVFPLVLLVQCWRRRSYDAILLMAALTAFLLIGTRILSPQYLIWLAPFLAFAWPSHRWLVVLYGAASWLTLFFIQWYWRLLDHASVLLVMLLLRNLLLVLLVGMLYRAVMNREVRTPRGMSPSAQGAS